MADETFSQQSVDALLKGIGQLSEIKIDPPAKPLELTIPQSPTEKMLAAAIYREGRKRVRAGADPLTLKRGMDKAVAALSFELRKITTPVDDSLIERIGTLSAHGDIKVGNVLAEAFQKAGGNIITIDDASVPDVSLDFVEGLQFDRGYLSPYFVNDPDRMEVVLDDPLVLLCDKKISGLADMLPVLNEIAMRNRPLVVVAEDVEGEALATLIVNKLRETIRVAAVKAPEYGIAGKRSLTDIATLTGGKVISKASTLDHVSLSDLGSARRIVIDQDNTTIIGDAGSSSSASGRFAVIKVGGASAIEMRETKTRIDEAVQATKLAIEEGIVPGKGVALFRAGRALDDLVAAGDELEGVKIIQRAIEEPYRSQEGPSLDPSLDVVDLIDAGIIDSAKTIRASLESANSVAGQLLTSESLSYFGQGNLLGGGAPAPKARSAPPAAAPALPRPGSPAALPAPSVGPPPGYAGATKGERSAPGPAPFTDVVRTPHMRLGNEPKAPGLTFTVSIYADNKAPAPGEETRVLRIEVPEGVDVAELRVTLMGTAHFEIAKARGTLVIPVRDDELSSTATFKVKVVDNALSIEGESRLTAYFMYKGRPCGSVARAIEIKDSGSPDPEDPEGPVDADIHTQPDAILADLNIYVADPSRDQRHLKVCVMSPHLPDLTDEFQPWSLPDKTDKFVDGVMQQFVREQTPGEMIDSLIGAGEDLWEAAPDILKQAYWQLIDGNLPFQTIAVISQEPYFPWELARPYRDGDSQERQPLGVAYAVGRWIHGKFQAPPQRVCVSASLIVAPKYDGTVVEDGEPIKALPHAQEEAGYVKAKVKGQQLPSVITYAKFADAIKKKDYDLLHIACHAATDTSPGVQTIHLEDGNKVNSRQIRGINKSHQGLGKQPLIFFNCCQLGQPTPSLVGADGFAKAFINAGAGAVIAPLWSVDDVVAHDVCKSFYEAMIARDKGIPLASIMKTIRKRAYDRRSGKDTYAAYIFYGDPNAVRVTKL